MIKLWTMAFAVLSTAWAATPSARAGDLPTTTRLDLFLLVGQSNMAGRGRVAPQDKWVDPRVWTLTKGDDWAPALDPLHFDKPKVAGVGPGRTFGITVAVQTSADVGLVPCAVGGTSIDQWKRGGTLYADAVRRATAAMARGTFKGILWHQGETDVDHKTSAAEYFPKLASLIADLRADLKGPDLPVVVGQIGRFYEHHSPGADAFNAGLAAFATAEPRCACVTSEGLTSNPDGVHFDAASQRELGRRYAAAYLKLATPSAR